MVFINIQKLQKSISNIYYNKSDFKSMENEWATKICIEMSIPRRIVSQIIIILIFKYIF